MSGQHGKVLIVEDDEAIALGLAMNLRIDGYEVRIAPDGEAALTALRAVPSELVILDLSLPKRTGLDVLRDMRARGDLTPVVVLSARQNEFDKVAALRLGADDYVTKPFALAELLARCAAVLRRTRTASEPASGGTPKTATFANIVVDFDEQRVTRAGEEITLTPLELRLLAFLVHNPAKVFARGRLLKEVWGVGAGSPRTVDNFIGQLRAKLEQDPARPRHLVTVRGSGYRFDT